MRNRFSVVVFLVAGFAIVALLMRADGGRPANAQSELPRPLFFNEVASWCLYGCSGRFEDLDNGYVRFVLNAEPDGSLDGSCSDMSIPDEIEGWAYMQSIDGSLPERPTYPAGASEDEISSIDRTWVATVPKLEGFEVFTIEQSRSQPFPFCELIARRTS